jgi:hypothetical protein
MRAALFIVLLGLGVRPVGAAGDGAKPVSCSGSKVLSIQGATIKSGTLPAVVASGSCRVTIVDSHVSSDLLGIDVSGSAELTIKNSVVSGKLRAISVSGSGHVIAKGSRFIGGRSISGSGRWTDQGGNSFE